MHKREVWIYLQPSFLDHVEYIGLCHKAVSLKNSLGCGLIAILMCAANKVTKLQGILRRSPFDEVKILVNDSFDELIESFYVKVLSILLEQNRPSLIIGYPSEHTTSVLSQVAYKHGLGMCADCVDFKLIKSKLIATRTAFQGQRYVDIQSTTNDTFICTVIADEINNAIVSDWQPKIKIISLNYLTCSQELLKVISVSYSNVEDKSNRVVLGIGNGFRRKDDVQRIIFLAQQIGIGVGTSKALVEKGWASFDLQVGMSGKQICPDVYIAVGISGAIQHIEGIKNSKTIIAVNNDPKSYIFKYSDIGIVSDVRIVLDILENIYKEGKIC